MRLNLRKRVLVCKTSLHENFPGMKWEKGTKRRFSSVRDIPSCKGKSKRRTVWLFLVILLLSFLVSFVKSVPDNEITATPFTTIPYMSDDANLSTTAALLYRHHHNNRTHQRDHRKHDADHQPQDHDDGHSSQSGESGSKVNQNNTLDEVFDSSFPNGFFIRVAQAKAMALSVENGIPPKLDENSQIMLRADCGKEMTCRDFNSCAEKKASSMIKDMSGKNIPSEANEITYYINEIRKKCGSEPYHSTPALPFNVELAPNNIPHPVPVFHCNAHVGSNRSVTNFRMEYPESISPPEGLPSDQIPRYFVIEVWEHPGTWVVNSIQPFWLLPFARKINDTFQIRVTAVSPKYIFRPVVSDSITLYDSSIQTIGKPVNLTVVNISVDSSATRPLPSALLRWKSGSGLNASCDFDVFNMDEDMKKEERKKAEDAFWVKLNNLQYEKSYSIKIMEMFGQNRESETLHYQLHIPSCLELRGYSFNLCRPPPITNVRLVNATESSFWIVWQPPKYMNSTNKILSYNITVDWVYTQSPADGLMHHAKPMQYNTQRIFSGNVLGYMTAAEIKNVTHFRGKFKVSVTAISSSGPSIPSWDVVYYKGGPLSAWTAQKILTLFVALLGVVCLVGVFCFLKNYHEKRQRKKKRQEKFENYEKESLQLQQQTDRDAMKWEIDCCSLILGDAIGQGYFGLVRRAILNRKGRTITVAVKTLRETTDEKEVEKFWEEFEILKDLEPHVHVVGLKGIVTKHVPLPLLVVEFCDGGDLQTHLRKADQSHSPSFRKKYCSPGSSTISSGSSIVNLSTENRVQVRIVTNEAYFMKSEAEELHLTLSDLLSYARQITCGMEYLSTNKIVHRDLAARNILIQNLGKQRILKISDFGLSRDVYEQNMYKKKTDGKVPFKWLAIECLLKEVYTTKSDVWSYGILLWEIFTYGGNPYPGVENRTVFGLLKEGYRMPRPEHCPEDVYALMRACWENEPAARPDFTTIRLILEDIIEQTTQVTYLNLEPPLESEIYENREPMLPPRRKNLPPLSFQKDNAGTNTN